jgi:predicted Fe-Mo cluster-binding NifX family protein
MIIAFPTNAANALASPVYGHFGSAAAFIFYDTENGSLSTIVNSDKDHLHGQCQPLNALGGHKADAIVVGGIGAGALCKLIAQGIKVYRAVAGTVQENLQLIQAGSLPEFTPDQTCSGHSQIGGCAH